MEIIIGRTVIGMLVCCVFVFFYGFYRAMLSEYTFKQILRGAGIGLLGVVFMYFVGLGVDCYWDIETGKLRKSVPKVVPIKSVELLPEKG